ncbi:MAG: carboxylesterase/lipase family protein [Acidobacteriota bacterium]
MRSPLLSRRNFLSTAPFAALAFRAGRLQALAPSVPLAVRTPLGPLVGEEEDGVRIFRGVPFAQPPVGPLRFRPPVPLKPWTGPRDATRFAAAAMQTGAPAFPRSEDCLYLNVWSPARPGPHPVYVWIHGGGFTNGSSFDPMFNGSMLAREGIVCVTLAYRLGIFGFLEMAPLLGPSYAGSANNGVRDIMAALEWVRQNIESLGGDPQRVTLGGESAGAKLTCVLLGAPSAKTLFQQGISESGGAERVATQHESERVGQAFGKQWKARTGKPFAALATAPAASLLPVQVQFTREWPHHFPLRPRLETSLLPRLPVEAMTAGLTRGRRLLIGTNLQEAALFIGPHPAHDASAANLGNLPLPQFLAVYRKYRQIYPHLSDEQRRIRALTAEEYWVPSLRAADAFAQGGGTAWMYRLDFHEGSGRLGAYAFHSLDLRLVWDRPSAAAADPQTEASLARTMHDAWCAFLRGQAPAASGLPPWPPYSPGRRPTMIFNTRSRVEDRPNEAELRLWDGVM